MARPAKQGIEYFSFDVDADQEDKIYFLESKHGITGFGVWVKLLMHIYKQGYYMMWTEREHLIFSRRVNVDINTLSSIVTDCINDGIFSREMFEKHQILTSHGIQLRYLKACERRKGIEFNKNYLLLSENELKSINADINIISADINANINPCSEVVNVDIMLTKTPQSKGKESKVNNKNGLNITCRGLIRLKKSYYGLTRTRLDKKCSRKLFRDLANTVAML